LTRLGLNFLVLTVVRVSVDQEVLIWDVFLANQDLDELSLVVDADVPDPISIDFPGIDPAHAAVAIKDVLAFQVAGRVARDVFESRLLSGGMNGAAICSEHSA
jgi:hypothetical protein